MPEMLDWCGRTFQVERRVEKACVDAQPLYSNRHFPDDDVVILAGPRCDGRDHDGCNRSCKIFWKEAWLEPVDGAVRVRSDSADSIAALQQRLKVKSDDSHYFCQSTQLRFATEAFPGFKKPWMVRIAFRELQNGDRSAAELLKLFLLFMMQRLRRILGGNNFLRGRNKRTPTESLGLIPGEKVRIKSRMEIVETLDARRRNRGMTVCYEMTRCCGSEAEVGIRVHRIIDERTGEMRNLQNTVTLENKGCTPSIDHNDCLCYDQLGDCPRGEKFFWREIWLERID